MGARADQIGSRLLQQSPQGFIVERSTAVTITRAVRPSLMILAAVVLCTVSLAAQNKVRIIQTNAAGDNVHIIDPASNTVVGVIEGIEVSHGAGIAQDGSRIYVSDEAEHTLDVVDARTLKVTNRIPLSGRPNNMAVGRDGRKVYVGIIE